MKHSTTGPLNARQIAVLEALTSGMEHQEIARMLGVSRVAVSENVRAAVRKLGVQNSHQAVAAFVQASVLRTVADRLEAWPGTVSERHRDDVHDLCTTYAAMFRGQALGLLP